MKLAGTLIGHRWGRVALHMRCCLRNGNVTWHWRGICREWNATTGHRSDRLAIRHATWLTAILIVLPCAARGSSAYLATIGPAPLRFQAPVTVQPKPLSSPLPQDAPVTNICMPETVITTNITITTQSASTMMGPPPVLPANEPPLTSQMIVEFFRSHPGPNGNGNGNGNMGNNGSNGNRDTSVFVPFDFTPPLPSSKPSSSATYEGP